MSGTNTPNPRDAAIVVPHTGSVSMRWAIRLSQLQMPPHTIVAKSTAAIDLAREEALKDALETNADWILFLDSDVIPPVDVYQRLRNRDVDIISGFYYMDNPDGIHPAMWKLNEDGSPAIAGYDREGVVNVDAVGLGCLLVNRDVFEEVERPWFRWTRGFDDHPWDLHQQGEPPGISEDFYFCYEAQQAGYDIYVDTMVKCLHEKTCFLSDDGVFLQSQINPTN